MTNAMLAIILLIQLRIWWLTQDSKWKIECAINYLQQGVRP